MAAVENESKTCSCEICGEQFASKTKMFKHLPIHGYQPKNAKPTKIILLVGWLSDVSVDDDVWLSEQVATSHDIDVTSKRVEEALFRALYLLENDLTALPEGVALDRPKGFSRGSSSLQRTSLVLATEPTCHGQSDTFCCYVRPFAHIGKDAWMRKLNTLLPGFVRVHEMFELSPAAAPNFHAEADCTQRRYEYIFPLRLILPKDAELPVEPIVRRRTTEMRSNLPKTSRYAMDQRFPADTKEGQIRIAFFRKLKTIFKVLAGKHRFHNFVTGGAAPGDSAVSRQLDRIYHKEIITIDDEDWVVFSVSGDSLLKGQVRKLIGLTLCIAMDIFPLESVEAALDASNIVEVPAVPGWALYIAECRYACWEAKYTDFKLDPRREGDGEAVSECIDSWTAVLHRHIVDVYKQMGDSWMQEFLATSKQMFERFAAVQLLRKRTRSDLEKIFEERFGTEALHQAQEVQRLTDDCAEAFKLEQLRLKKVEQEEEKKKNSVEKTGRFGKYKKKKKLSPEGGGSSPLPSVEMDVVSETEEVEASALIVEEELKASTYVAENVSPAEPTTNVDADDVLDPMGLSGRTGNNMEYRQRVSTLAFISVPESRDDVPAVYAEVLRLLRLADRSQGWPSSSTGRQQVIAYNTLLESSGRGGSFSVGALPKHLVQPKGNIIFPELMKACFRLEKALMPDRPPSATIAINRHAQFLPHRDSGAGAGQCKSLIVSLGTFSGGEIVSNNIAYDIRYNPIEFDGWNSLHYTLPFVGERYSLVWFTPLGLGRDDMWWWDDDDMSMTA